MGSFVCCVLGEGRAEAKAQRVGDGDKRWSRGMATAVAPVQILFPLSLLFPPFARIHTPHSHTHTHMYTFVRFLVPGPESQVDAWHKLIFDSH